MKKLISSVFAAAVILFSSANASAQVHAGIGAGLGFDGGSVEAAVSVTPFLQLRAGVNFIPALSLSMEMGRIQVASDYVIDNLIVQGTTDIKSFNAMLDLFPGRRTNFHFTVGLYSGNGTLLTATNEDPKLDEGMGMSFGPEKNIFVSADENGQVHLAIATEKTVMPYFGIGSGRALNPNKRVSACFDLGACYCGGIHVAANGLNMRNGQMEDVFLTSEDAMNKDKGFIDMLSQVPILPVMKLSVFVRIF